MENKFVKYSTPTGAEISLSVDIVRNVICNGNNLLTETEILQFIELCRYNGYNPYLKEAYLVKYKGKNGNPDKCSIIVSKETFLKRAENNPDYDGQKSGIFVLRNNEITKVVGTLMLQGDTLLGGWAEVYRKSQKVPTEITVSLGEYHQGNSMWNGKPATMIRKVALMQALRESFANQLGASYTEEEIPIDVDADVVESKPPTQPQKAGKASSNKETPKAVDAAKPRDKKKEGRDKVMAYLDENNLSGAFNGIEWLKANYPNDDFSDLAEKAAEKANEMQDI